MAQPVTQASFNSGEWAPQLYSRVDLQKFHSGAALLENFFVDYRGGASTRTGTKYILQARNSAAAVRLIGFQPSFNVGYILEFGDFYLRFYNNGSPVLETGIAITGATKANPCVVTVANTYAVNDIVYITGVVGMTQLNNAYYKITARTAGTITLADLNGVAINSTSFGTWTSSGTVQRVYTVTTPYAASDLALLKFAQNISTLVLTNPNYVPYQLVFTSATSWALTAISFGATLAAPTGLAVTAALAAGSYNYSFIVTAVNLTGEESVVSSPVSLLSRVDFRITGGTIVLTWNAVTNAAYYNVYMSMGSYVGGSIPAGVMYGYLGFSTGLSFVNTYLLPDFTDTTQIPQNPFSGSGVATVSVTAPGSYTTVTPTVTFSAPGGSGVTATGNLTYYAKSVVITAGGSGYRVDDSLVLWGSVSVQVTVVSSPGPGQPGAVQGVNLLVTGPYTGALPTGSVPGQGPGTGGQFLITWGVYSVNILNPGSGYGGAPTVTFAPVSATATAILGATSLGNPATPAFWQQRLWFGNQVQASQTLNASQPGLPYNFNTTNPVKDDNAISGSLNTNQLSDIKSMVPVPAGLLILTSSGSVLLNGGSPGSPATPSALVANAQSYNGANDLRPIIANFDVLHVTSKGSAVRNLVYDFGKNIYTGTDISVISSQLFYGYTITDWAWAQEPYKVVWAVRSDGELLSLTYLKEQELVAWAHSTTNGLFKSVATVIEYNISLGTYVDAVYAVVQRTVNGNTVQYIERFAERVFTSGATSAWCVDAGLQYTGSPATTFTGAQHLAGMTCTGLADGVVIPSFTMPTNGTFTLTTAASTVTVGLGFECNLQTLPLDVGEPTIQGKQKKIADVNVRVADTLGLYIGSDEDNLTRMKDLVVGNVGSQTNEVVTGLVTGDAVTVLDPRWQEIGQFYIRQSDPLPASVLGVFPGIVVGDTK